MGNNRRRNTFDLEELELDFKREDARWLRWMSRKEELMRQNKTNLET